MTAGFDVQVASSAAEVGQEAWDRLAGGRPFAGYRWYCFGETIMGYARPAYVILHRHGAPAARATFWLSGREELPVESPLIRGVAQRLLRRWPLLICQSPPSSAACSGLILPDPPLRRPALAAILDTAQDLARRHGASFVMFPYLRAAAAQDGWPSGTAWTNMAEPGTALAIAWADMAGYLAHLGKKRRYNLQRMCRQAAGAGITVSRRAKGVDINEAMRLHMTVNRRHGSGTEPWMRAAMENAAMVDSLWLVAEKGGRLVGCELMLGDEGAWFVTGLGLDYAEPHVYFPLSYADIEFAIERRARLLRWGSGAYDVKRRLGFEPEGTSWIAFRGRHRLAQRLGQWLASQAPVAPATEAADAS